MTSISDKNCTNKDVMDSYLYLQKTQKKRATLRTCYAADWSSGGLAEVIRAWGDARGVEAQAVGVGTSARRRRPKVAATASIAERSAGNVARVKQIIGEMAKSL